MADVNFFLKDTKKEQTTVDAILRYKGQRYKIPTGEKVLTKHWNASKYRCKEVRAFPGAGEINMRLDLWEQKIKSVLNEFALKMEIPDVATFKDAVRKNTYGDSEDQIEGSLVDYVKSYIDSCGKSEGTKKQYQTTLNWLKNYESHSRGTLTFADINSVFYRKFRTFFYTNGGNSPNFFGTTIKNIKFFMNNSAEDGLHNHKGHEGKSFIREEVESDSIYLTVDELLSIHELQFTDEFIKEHHPEIKPQNLQRKKKSLELVRGRFLIGAFTALRVSDFSRLDELNIKDNFIRIRTEKTDYPVVIPIHWVIKEILENGFDLTEKVSDQKINKQIKEICKMAKIIQEVTITKMVAGKSVEETYKKYELVTTHTARRSAATNMYKAEISTLKIMKITGHKTEKAFLKYIRVSQEENARMLADHAFFKR